MWFFKYSFFSFCFDFVFIWIITCFWWIQVKYLVWYFRSLPSLKFHLVCLYASATNLFKESSYSSYFDVFIDCFVNKWVVALIFFRCIWLTNYHHHHHQNKTYSTINQIKQIKLNLIKYTKVNNVNCNYLHFCCFSFIINVELTIWSYALNWLIWQNLNAQWKECVLVNGIITLARQKCDTHLSVRPL